MPSNAPLGYLGVRASTPPNAVQFPRAPNTKDFANFKIGDFWLNTVTFDAYILVSKASQLVGAQYVPTATWVNFSTGPSGPLETLTASDGSVASPVANNITFPDAVIPALLTVDSNLESRGSGANFTLNVKPIINLPDTNAAGTAGQIQFGGARFLHNGGDINNTFVGRNSGNITNTSADCIGVGADSLASLGAGADFNVAVGADALNALTTGTGNQVFGTNALSNLVTGNENCAIGFFAGDNYTGAESNNLIIGNLGVLGESNVIRIGEYGAGGGQQNKCFIAACYSNFGTDNCFVGEGTGNTTLTATGSTGVGSLVLQSLTNGNGNTCVGGAGGQLITSGAANTSLGFEALDALVTGDSNLVLGAGSGGNYTGAESANIILNNLGVTGESNVIRIGEYGAGAAQQNKCFIAACYSNFGTNNTFSGEVAGNTTLSGANNTALGAGVLSALTTGPDNCCGGATSGFAITTGDGNTAWGSGSLNALVSGDENIAIGHDAASNYTGAESNNIIIGNLGTAADSAVIRVGTNGTHTTCFIAGIRGVTTGNADAVAVLVDSADQLGTVSSSERYKMNIAPMGAQSSIIHSLRPVTFNYKKHPESPAWGLIAEEVDKVFPQLVVYDDEDRPETVKYHDLVPLLLNEVQQLTKRVKELEKLCQSQTDLLSS